MPRIQQPRLPAPCPPHDWENVDETTHQLRCAKCGEEWPP